MADFESRLESYLDKLDAMVQNRGLEKTTEMRSEEPFLWLALYQVGVEPINSIAKK